jgi:hypothetical protein
MVTYVWYDPAAKTQVDAPAARCWPNLLNSAAARAGYPDSLPSRVAKLDPVDRNLVGTATALVSEITFAAGTCS